MLYEGILPAADRKRGSRFDPRRDPRTEKTGRKRRNGEYLRVRKSRGKPTLFSPNLAEGGPIESSHAGGHWFESSSLHQKEPDFLWNQVLFFHFCNFFVHLQCPDFLPFLIDHRNTTDRKTPADAGVSFFRFHGRFPASRSCLRSAWISAFMVVIRTFSFSSHSSRV